MENNKVNVASSVQIRNDILESQKRVNYHNEFERLHGARKLSALDPTAKARMKDLQNKARQSLKGEDT